MNKIAKFEKVSYEQFEQDWLKNMGGEKEEIRKIYDSIKLPHRLRNNPQVMIFTLHVR